MALVLDREKAGKAFETFLSDYDLTNKDIEMKRIHTMRVAENCRRIAEAEGLDPDLAWLIGILHDIGRFPQLSQYDTFWDLASMDHAEAGAELLFGSRQLIDLFTESREEDSLIESAVRYHSAFRLPDGLSEAQTAYCLLIRDADKLDIFRVFWERPPHEIYRCEKEEFLEQRISEPVMEAIRSGSTVRHALKKCPADRYAGILSLIFELHYASARVIAQQQGFYQKLFTVPFRDPEMVCQLNEIRLLSEQLSR